MKRHASILAASLASLLLLASGSMAAAAGPANATGVGPNVLPPLIPEAPTLTWKWSINQIPLNAASQINFTLTNPNAAWALSHVGLDITLPINLAISTGTAYNICNGGTIKTTAPTGIHFSGGSLGKSKSCKFNLIVKGVWPGTASFSTYTVSTPGNTGPFAIFTAYVLSPPSISAAFSSPNGTVGAATSLAFTLSNPGLNTKDLTGVNFTAPLPAGLAVSTKTSSVCGGTLTLTAPTGISFSGGTVAKGASCVVTAPVVGKGAGSFTVVTSSVKSHNGGTGKNATASVTMYAPKPTPTPTLAPGATPAPTQSGGPSAPASAGDSPEASASDSATPSASSSVSSSASQTQAASPTSPAGPTGSDGGGSGPLPIILAAVIVLLAGGLLGLLFIRRKRSAGESGPTSAA